MNSNTGLLPFRLALVTEARQREDPWPSVGSRDLDMTTPQQAVWIRDLMAAVVEDVTVFDDLAKFIRHAQTA